MPLFEDEEVGFKFEKTAITFLKIFAWVDLFCGIIGALIIWAKFPSTKITSGLYYQTTETITNPVAIGIGIAVLLQGIFAWAFFLVVAYIALNIIAIRENTTPRQESPK